MPHAEQEGTSSQRRLNRIGRPCLAEHQLHDEVEDVDINEEGHRVGITSVAMYAVNDVQ